MLKRIIKIIFVWRLALFIVAFAAFYFFPARDCCQLTGLPMNLNYLFRVFGNFAGQDFLDLAKYGYGYPLKVSTYLFFPVYPALIRDLTTLIPDYLASGLIISHLCLVLALFFLYRLVKIDFSEKTAKMTLLLILFFPAAFFFGSVYTESFFLLIVVLTFYLARREHFFLACLLALIASATRIAGIFLWPALIWEIWHRRHLSLSLTWLILPPLGLIAYMRFLLKKTADPLYFLKVSPDFGPNLVISKLILLHQVFYRYAKMLLFTHSPDLTFIVVILELFVGILFLILTIFAFKKLRLSYAIYMLLSYLIPTFTGTFAGMPRFALTLFPGFILLSLWFSRQKPLVQKIYLGLNFLMAVLMTALFTRGYFVG